MLRRSGQRGVSAERLASEFEVSVRTIKRDLDALESSGAPVWSRPGPGGGYGLATGASLPPVSLSSSQAVEIGRASCRERAKSRGAGGGTRKNAERHAERL